MQIHFKNTALTKRYNHVNDYAEEMLNASSLPRAVVNK